MQLGMVRVNFIKDDNQYKTTMRGISRNRSVLPIEEFSEAGIGVQHVDGGFVLIDGIEIVVLMERGQG